MEHETDILTKTAIVWFRNDLRIHDNAALVAASRHAAVIPLFIREADGPARPLGAARRWWLHHSLAGLSEKLERLGAPLHLISGDPTEVIPELVRATGASAVYWNRRYDPAHQSTDADLKNHLHSLHIDADSFAGQLLHEPTRLRTGGGTYYKVYSPFWRALESDLETSPPMPLPAPGSLAAFDGATDLASESLDDWQLLPTGPDWSGGIAKAWTPGEDGAHDRLSEFLENRLRGYAERRDIPGKAATSGLSAHLATGEITPAQIFDALSQTDNDASNEDRSRFRKEIAWREFSWHLLVNNPGLPDTNHNSKFDAFPWVADADAVSAWQKGMTGYPVVDAGMRQLWQTGWMHNRVRMIVSSFLIKHLMIDWREGEAWFWDTLVDADPASNAASWQWVAGSGADASPYYRIFNPILQGDKFDGDGSYVREFVPELAGLPDKFIHKPWTAPEDVLLSAGIRLGETYPRPIVDHQAARQRALASYKSIKDAA
ncbi:cryptochrome/photolyase family protein [Hoeflea ulvae]|uniref:DNA photolyase family protein n=1 Tax=Hoeflea ulvae TaxID=2983764 RepID=A0ABT3YHE9_9HYPH|nr:deoxyribodipyrimidine photo-lyase [Hoeflea ulvae]MCY0095238.1 DNA photolyase family protein [Hoeflea ulvae]